MKKQINDLLLKMQAGENCIGETANKLLDLFSVSKRFWYFDCWDRTGNMKTITIEALNEENATIIFKAKHEDLGYDPPN